MPTGASLKRATLAALSAGAVMLAVPFLPGCGSSSETESAGPALSELNYPGDGSGGGNKAVNLSGYEYVDSTHLNIYFNHQFTALSEVDASMFVVKPDTGGSDLVQSIIMTSGTGYSGCSATNLNKGTKIAVTLSSAMSADTLYKVSINGTLTDDNGLTLGNYTNRKETSFVFRTPTSCGGDPVVCSWSNTTPRVSHTLDVGAYVPYEQNLVVIFDRPIDPSTLSTFLSSLSANYKKEGTMVVQDSDNSTTHDPVDYAESYTPHSNNSGVTSNINTTFFFPEFVSSRYLPVYNRDSSGSYSYELTLPSFTDKSAHTFTDLGTIEFTTISSDLPGWLDDAPTTTAGSGSLTVSWNATSLIAAYVGTTTGYDVYYTAASNKWTGTYTLGCSTSGTPLPTSCTINGLTSSQPYWVRVVAKNGVGETGYSRAGSGTPN
jgi:hypothetical protein